MLHTATHWHISGLLLLVVCPVCDVQVVLDLDAPDRDGCTHLPCGCPGNGDDGTGATVKLARYWQVRGTA